MKFLIFFLGLLCPAFGLAQNPFEFLGKTRADIEQIIGKPVAKDYGRVSDGNKVEQFAYPFTAYGGYHIGFVNDTAKAFIYTPKAPPEFSKSIFNFSQLYPSATLTEAEVQADESRKTYTADVVQSGKPRQVIVDCLAKNGKVAKVTFL